MVGVEKRERERERERDRDERKRNLGKSFSYLMDLLSWWDP
jgi:hypothetical protein